MGLHLIAALYSPIWVTWCGASALAVIALGMVIFVHELGHFVVAKLCGVKCEKFYLGFDIGGWKFCKFRWGETEYGIGILPLGGYVKMLGQEDNPARLREEIERAKQQRRPSAADGDTQPGGSDATDARPTRGPAATFTAAEAERPWPPRNKRSTIPAATWPRAFPSGWRSFRPG